MLFYSKGIDTGYVMSSIKNKENFNNARKHIFFFPRAKLDETSTCGILFHTHLQKSMVTVENSETVFRCNHKNNSGVIVLNNSRFLC